MSAIGLLFAFDAGIATAFAAYAFGCWTRRRKERR